MSEGAVGGDDREEAGGERSKRLGSDLHVGYRDSRDYAGAGHKGRDRILDKLLSIRQDISANLKEGKVMGPEPGDLLRSVTIPYVFCFASLTQPLCNTYEYDTNIYEQYTSASGVK